MLHLVSTEKPTRELFIGVCHRLNFSPANVWRFLSQLLSLLIALLRSVNRGKQIETTRKKIKTCVFK